MDMCLCFVYGGAQCHHERIIFSFHSNNNTKKLKICLKIKANFFSLTFIFFFNKTNRKITNRHVIKQFSKKKKPNPENIISVFFPIHVIYGICFDENFPFFSLRSILNFHLPNKAIIMLALFHFSLKKGTEYFNTSAIENLFCR